MISPQKIRANQQNALRSTGPRSISGKRRSARNSVRHGLSISGLAPFEEPKVEAILDLLRVEYFGESEAKAIAQAIVVYERNEAHQQESFQLQFPGLGAGQDRIQESIAETASVVSEGTKFLIGGIPILGARSPEVQDLRFLVEIARRFHRVFNSQQRKNVREYERDYQRARRYYKRAANQLAKSIKAAADPTILE